MNEILAEQLLDILKLSISGIISLLTTYIILIRQSKQKKIDGGIEFYRSKIHHLFPIIESVAKLESTYQTLSIALKNTINGERAFPAMHDGLEYLKKEELQNLIESEAKNLHILSKSAMLDIFPATLSLHLTNIWYWMYLASKENWSENPKDTLEKIEHAYMGFRKFRLSLNQVLGLVDSYHEVCKDSKIDNKSAEDILNS